MRIAVMSVEPPPASVGLSGYEGAVGTAAQSVSLPSGQIKLPVTQNAAPSFRSVLMLKVHEPVPEHAPPHPLKVKPDAALGLTLMLSVLFRFGAHGLVAFVQVKLLPGVVVSLTLTDP